jgi:hypothetical protein
MPHIALSEFVYDCRICHTPCNGNSKGVYTFENDTAFSEQFEKRLTDKINASNRFTVKKCSEAGYPDLVVYNQNGGIHTYLEVKVQQRTFMSVAQILPQANLQPSETVALNLSDLLRYFAIAEKTKHPVSIVWVLLNRPCIVRETDCFYFVQTLERLKEIYTACGNKRRFRRRSGMGDVVDGQHKGVTVNYHFSLKELKPWCTESLLQQV